MVVHISWREVVLSELDIAFFLRLIQEYDIALWLKTWESTHPAHILVERVESDDDVEVLANALEYIHHELLFSWLFPSPTVLDIIRIWEVLLSLPLEE